MPLGFNTGGASRGCAEVLAKCVSLESNIGSKSRAIDQVQAAILDLLQAAKTTESRVNQRNWELDHGSSHTRGCGNRGSACPIDWMDGPMPKVVKCAQL